MSELNCSNCGAPISADSNKCPFCGTSYFDLSAIDVGNHKPFYLKLKMGDTIFTQLVKLSPDISIDYEQESVMVYDGSPHRYSVCTSKQMTTNLKFEAVTTPNIEPLYVIEKP